MLFMEKTKKNIQEFWSCPGKNSALHISQNKRKREHPCSLVVTFVIFFKKCMHGLTFAHVFYVSLHEAQRSLGSPPVRLSTKRLKPGLGRNPTAETWRFLLLFIWWEVVCYAKQKIAWTFLGGKKKRRTGPLAVWLMVSYIWWLYAVLVLYQAGSDISFPD